MKTVEEVLRAVRNGGYYDALPDEREADYLDVDVALQAIEDIITSSVIGEDEATHLTKNGALSAYETYELEPRRNLRAEQRANLSKALRENHE